MPNAFPLSTLVHYICWKCDGTDELGATKLHKVLWFSDVKSYLERGYTVTSSKYRKRPNGPCSTSLPHVLSNLEEAGAIRRKKADCFGHSRTHYEVLVSPDMTGVSEKERDFIDEVIEDVCRQHTAAEVSARSHGFIFSLAEDGEEIPVYAMLAETQAVPTAAEIEWATAIARRGMGMELHA
jgi:hypothetical protein